MTKPAAILLLICMIETGGFTQTSPISSFRSLDDNHALAIDSSDWKFHRNIKEIPVQKGTSGMLISFGGEIREQLRYFNHVNFGDVDSGISDQDLYLQHRFLLHTDLRIKQHLRFFIQFNSCHVTGKNTLSPQVDRDDLGLMQAFADVSINLPYPVKLRLGRQEFSFGPERMLGLREGPSIRQTYDGARLTINLSKASGDFFLVQPVSYNQGAFDNSWRRNEFVLASYWSFLLIEKNMMDVYCFNNRSQNVSYANDTANDNRFSAGLRFSKTEGSFGYDIEYTYQSGKHGHQDIHAWQISSQISYRWQNLSRSPRLLIREAVFSGDRQHDDGVINTFRPVSAKPPVHDLVPIGPANIAVISPEAEILLSEGLTFTFRYLTVRRLSSNDGMYTPDVRKMVRKIDTSFEKLGTSITKGFAVEFNYTVNKHLNMLLFGGIFKAGKYIRNTGRGSNVEACSLRVTYKL